MGSECSNVTTETQYTLTSDELRKMCLWSPQLDRPIGSLEGYDWRKGEGVQLNLHLDVESTIITLHNLLGISWETTRSILYRMDQTTQIVKIGAVIPESMIGYAFNQDKGDVLNVGTNTAEG